MCGITDEMGKMMGKTQDNYCRSSSTVVKVVDVMLALFAVFQ